MKTRRRRGAPTSRSGLAQVVPPEPGWHHGLGNGFGAQRDADQSEAVECGSTAPLDAKRRCCGRSGAPRRTDWLSIAGVDERARAKHRAREPPGVRRGRERCRGGDDVYDGAGLRPCNRIDGPAIVEEPFTAIVVYPGQMARLDAFGTYRIEL